MKKNVLFWVGIKSKDPYLIEKHGNFKYLDVSRFGDIKVDFQDNLIKIHSLEMHDLALGV